MAQAGLNLKIIDEIRRLKSLGFGKRKISRTLGVHRNTVSRHFDDEIVASPGAEASIVSVATPEIDRTTLPWCEALNWQTVRDDVLKGVPINVLYEELFDKGEVTVQYPAFWKQLTKRAPILKTTMVRVFQPGYRTEIDYCDGIDIVNIATGEAIKTELFVGVLCSSRYAFAEFTMTQKSEDFLESHVRMFEYFGGCSQVLSPDNLKSAVTKAHRYDPVINPGYTKLASHYGFAVVPARVRRPQDKAIVERTIQIFQRWFFMRVRRRTFTSLIELNQCLKEHLVDFNNRKHRIFGRTRTEMFKAQEQATLMPLAPSRFEVQTYGKATLSRDCHLVFEQNYYSAPYGLRGQVLEIWATSNTVEICHSGERVALHGRSRTGNKFITDPKHYPPGAQAYLEEDVEKLIAWSRNVGVATAALVNSLFAGAYPLRHLRRVGVILNLSTRYGKAELETACVIANRYGQTTSQYIERVMKQNGASELRKTKGGEPIRRESNSNLRGIAKITLH